ncbi:centromere protein K isoform X3 [Erinaceus europaeus]|uniref:Centromere protein K isoform X3 n=1 Tax=Erinaceus europaeus TaxID=9365 RepID=A0ABM3XEL5_ERIEU|nr:centromere protein K isoform X3 [Erinaceus europaeus]
MSMSQQHLDQQDLDPDSTTEVENNQNAEEELFKECEEMWKDMEECQNKLSLVGTETLTDSNAQFTKLKHDLELVLSTVQSKNEKLKEDLEREQQWLREQQQIMESLNALHNKMKEQIVTFSESRVISELKTKLHDIKEYRKKLLITMGEFLEDHFPLPDRNAKKKKKNKETTEHLITLHEILELSLGLGAYTTNPLLLEATFLFCCPCLLFLLLLLLSLLLDKTEKSREVERQTPAGGDAELNLGPCAW